MGKLKYLIISALLTLTLSFQSLANATPSNADIMTTDELYLDSVDVATVNIYRHEVILPEGYEQYMALKDKDGVFTASFFNSDTITQSSKNTSGLHTIKTGPCIYYKTNSFDDMVAFLLLEDKSELQSVGTTGSIYVRQGSIYSLNFDLYSTNGATLYMSACDWVNNANSYEDPTPPETEDPEGGDGTGGSTGDGGGYDDSNLIGKLKSWFQSMTDAIVNMRDKVINAINTMIGSIQASIADLGNAIIERINAMYNEIIAIPDKIAELFLIDFEIIKEKMEELKGNFKIIDEVKGLWSHFRSSLEKQTKTTPTLTINLPEKYGGGSYQLLNLEPFEPYRDDIKTAIGAFLLINYLQLLFKQIPAIIQGGASITEHTTGTTQNEGYYVWTMPEKKGIEQKRGWLLGNNQTYHIEDKRHRRK